MNKTGFDTKEHGSSGFHDDKIYYEHQTVKVHAETDVEKNRIDAEKEAVRIKSKNEAKRINCDLLVSTIDRLISPSFLSFIVIIGLISIGAFIVWKKPFANAMEFWNLILPIITSFMGYAFGRLSTQKKDKDKLSRT